MSLQKEKKQGGRGGSDRVLIKDHTLPLFCTPSPFSQKSYLLNQIQAEENHLIILLSWIRNLNHLKLSLNLNSKLKSRLKKTTADIPPQLDEKRKKLGLSGSDEEATAAQ